jgi:hypothetical protein
MARLAGAGIDQSTTRFLGTGLWDDKAVMNEGLATGGWFAAPEPTGWQNFSKRYGEIYSEEPPRLATLAYDGVALAGVLARHAGPTGAGANPYHRAALLNPNGFAGIDGIFRFDHTGLVERGLAILEIQRGQVKVIDPSPKSF